MLALSLGAVLLLGGAAILAIGALRQDSTDVTRGEEPNDPRPAAPDSGARGGDAGPRATRLPARDPFAEPLPEDLVWLRKSLEGSGRSRAERQRRHEISRRWREDPRVHLIFGHSLATKGWFTNALERYERAARLVPAVRGDPALREHLVDAMAARGERLRARAFELLQEVYGEETLDVLLWAAYEHPRQPPADAAVEALDQLGMRARLDPVLHAIGDVRRAVPCPERRAALDRLRGRRDPRIATALEALRRDDPAAAACLGELLDAVIESSR
jgi:hypothetical protein